MEDQGFINEVLNNPNMKLDEDKVFKIEVIRSSLLSVKYSKMKITQKMRYLTDKNVEFLRISGHLLTDYYTKKTIYQLSNIQKKDNFSVSDIIDFVFQTLYEEYGCEDTGYIINKVPKNTLEPNINDIIVSYYLRALDKMFPDKDIYSKFVKYINKECNKNILKKY